MDAGSYWSGGSFILYNFDKVTGFAIPAALSWVLDFFVVSAVAGVIQIFYAVRLECISKLDDQVMAQVAAAVNSLAGAYYNATRDFNESAVALRVSVQATAIKVATCYLRSRRRKHTGNYRRCCDKDR